MEKRQRTRQPVKCHRCGVEFTPTGSYAKWCSSCRPLETTARYRDYEQRQRSLRKCLDCGANIGRQSTGRCRPCGQKAAGKNRTGERSAQWKGGRSHSKGYVYLLVAPEARKGHRYRAEHIVVWEKANGKPLPKGWVVHHRNGVKHDNRPENLQALPNGKHNHHDRRIALLEEQLKQVRAELKALHQLKMDAKT